jgi:O-antigen/teichoic acid export membrane protein
MKLYGILRFNALFLSALVLLIFLRQSETDWAPIKSFVFAALAIGIIGLILFYREYGLRLPLQKSRFQKIIDISYPMLLASSMGLIIGWVDTFMLGYFVDEKAVGIYNVAYKVAFVSSILLTTVTTVISPRVARLSSMNQYEELKVMVKNIAKMLSLGAALIFLVTIFNMELILSFFGKEFIAGASALGVLLIGQFISSYSGPVAMLLQMTGHEKNFMYISIVAMLMNVVLNLTLIPSYGFMGAAIASAATLIANNLMCVYFVKKKLGFYSFYIPFK